MAITIEKDRERDLTVFRGAGEISFDEFGPVLEAFYREDPTRNVLYDLSEGSIKSFTLEDIQHILSIAEKYAVSRESGKSAIVSPRDINFGISSMIQAYSYKLPIKVGVFRTVDEAMKWLDEKD